MSKGLLDQPLYEAEVGEHFTDPLGAARHYLSGEHAAVLLPHPLVDPLELPRRVRMALRKQRVRPLVEHLRTEGRLGDVADVERVAVRRRELLKALECPVPTVEPATPDWLGLRAALDSRVTGRVSVVIPTWNDAVMTERAVTCVLQRSDHRDLEVLVVDNGSRRDLGGRLELAFAEEPRVVVQRLDRNAGFAMGSNIGFATSSGEHIVFLNNDTEVQPGWLSPLLSRLAHADVLGVQPLLLYPDGSVQSAGTVFPVADSLPCHFLVGEPSARAAGVGDQRFRAVTAAALAMRATEVVRLAGFDTMFVNGLEDVDLCLRAATEPAFVVEPDSVVVHHESQTPGRGRHIADNRTFFMARWQGRLPAPELWRWPQVGLEVVSVEQDRRAIPAPRPVVRPLE